MLDKNIYLQIDNAKLASQLKANKQALLAFEKEKAHYNSTVAELIHRLTRRTDQ
jgi:DNA-binding XRE family transcriptional regulator